MDEELKEKIDIQLELLSKISEDINEIKEIFRIEESQEDFEYKDKLFKVNYEEFQKSNLSKLDYAEILCKISKMIEKYKLLNNAYKEFCKYNSQYKEYLINEIKNTEKLYEDFHTKDFKCVNTSVCYAYVSQYITNINNLININFSELFDNFKYGNKNYVIFGKNGAGKTTLLHEIKENCLNQNSFVIPANRKFNCDNFHSLNYNEINNKLNNVFDSDKSIEILMLKILNKQNSQLINAHRKGEVCNENTIVDIACNIFLELNLERKLDINNDNQRIYLYNENIEKYELVGASDGEKDIVYLILSILLLPQNAYIFIDEPENHLNGILMIDLFDKLEEYRKDLKFIYVTHNIDFIESRDNIELIYLEKTKMLKEWKFKKIETFKDIDLDIILSIEGSKKDIIFCEGNNNTSFDYKIYSEIYKDYLIKPISSCEKVCENVKVINDFPDFRRKAFGIIDNDFKEKSECEKLEVNHIYTLNFSEIENLLIDKEIVEKVNELVTNSDNMEQVYQIVIEFTGKSKILILNDYLNKKYNRLIKSNVLEYSDNLENDIMNMNEKNKELIIGKIEELSQNIDNYVKNNNYEEISKIIPGKMVLKKIAEALGFKNKESYFDFIVNKLKQDNELRNLIINKLPKFDQTT